MTIKAPSQKSIESHSRVSRGQKKSYSSICSFYIRHIGRLVCEIKKTNWICCTFATVNFDLITRYLAARCHWSVILCSQTLIHVYATRSPSRIERRRWSCIFLSSFSPCSSLLWFMNESQKQINLCVATVMCSIRRFCSIILFFLFLVSLCAGEFTLGWPQTLRTFIGIARWDSRRCKYSMGRRYFVHTWVPSRWRRTLCIAYMQ